MIDENLTEFGGYAVVDWKPDDTPGDLSNTAVRIRLDWDEADEGLTWPDRFFAFLDQPESGTVPALLVGMWGESDAPVEPIVEALVTARDRLPNLKALFIGDIICEENEISWIQQGDMAPILSAYSDLVHFRVRGGTGLRFGANQRMPNLKELVIETGGLNRSVIHQVLGMDLPALEHLEIWTGSEDYGADSTVDDLAPLFSGTLFPSLTRLGICDCEYTDEAVQAISQSPLLSRLTDLDLSLGTLSDTGAEVILNSPAFRHLASLDLDHHYCTEAVTERLTALGPQVSVEDRQGPEDTFEGRRFVAVGE